MKYARHDAHLFPKCLQFHAKNADSAASHSHRILSVSQPESDPGLLALLVKLNSLSCASHSKFMFDGSDGDAESEIITQAII